VRAERLLALAGGEVPVERFRTFKVTWKRKLNWGDSQPLEFYADLIFTDAGLLVAKHVQLPRRNESGNAAWMHAGLIGLIIYSIAESRRMSREKTRAEEVYYRESEDWLDAKPGTVFRRLALAEFFPADEITEASFTRRGVLKFKFRGKWCFATPDDREQHEDFRLPAHEEFHGWLTEAAEARAARAGGPPVPSPASVAEWGQRPASQPPAWVVDAVRTMEQHWGNRPDELLKWVPKTYHPQMFHRLGEVDAPEARAWHARLGKKLRVKGIVLLVVAVVLGIAGGTLAAIIASNANGPNDDGPLVGAALIGGISGVIALACGISGLVTLSRYRSRTGVRDE
jgi:hypothetical protein